MPGKVIAVLVSEGDVVEKGQGLVIVEAMKMENEVHSPIGVRSGKSRSKQETQSKAAQRWSS